MNYLATVSSAPKALAEMELTYPQPPFSQFIYSDAQCDQIAWCLQVYQPIWSSLKKLSPAFPTLEREASPSAVYVSLNQEHAPALSPCWTQGLSVRDFSCQRTSPDYNLRRKVQISLFIEPPNFSQISFIPRNTKDFNPKGKLAIYLFLRE